MGAVVSSMTAPYGYTAGDNAIFGGVFIFFGVAGSFFFGILLDKYQKFKLIINITSWASVLFIFTSFFTLSSGSVPLFAINLALVGFTIIPIIPISYSFAVELTFPVPESLSNGMIILPSQIYGTVLGLLASKLCDYSPMYAMAVFQVSAIVGAFTSIFIVEELRRLRPNKVMSMDSNGSFASDQLDKEQLMYSSDKIQEGYPMQNSNMKSYK